MNSKPPSSSARWRRHFPRIDGHITRLVWICGAILLGMAILTSGRFLNSGNLTAMAFQFPELGLFALAITLSLLTGGIDLSIVSTANLAATAAALVLTHGNPEGASAGGTGLRVTFALAVAAGTGTLCGLTNGILIARAHITPILATLGTMQLFMGFALVITRGSAIAGFLEPFVALGNGFLMGIPIPLWIFAALAGATAVLLNHTRLGRQLALLGTNPVAARYSGFRVEGLLLKTYALSGLLAAVAGIVMIAHTNSAKADYGSSYLLQAVLVAILGGVNPAGGFATATGIFLAVISLQFLSSGFSMLRLGNFTKEFAWGAMLLLVMAMNALGQRFPLHPPAFLQSLTSHRPGKSLGSQ